MGTTLTGTTPQDTYDSLIKVTDNGPLSGSLKTLTDGLGNDSALALSTGAASVTGTLAVSGLTTLTAPALSLRLGNATGNSGANIMIAGASTTKNWSLGVQQNVGGGLEFTPTATNGATTLGTTPAMVILDAGNVGIGTNAPNTKLDVNGTINVRNNGYEFGRITTNNVTGVDGGLTFQYITGGVFTNGLLLNSAGNVGIGTSSPATTLEVNGEMRSTRSGVNSQYIEISGGDAVGGFITNTGVGKVLTIRNSSTGSSDVVFDQTIASTYTFKQAGTQILRIDADGVKFGTDTAAANALDDYEEGTFTATLAPSTSGTITLSVDSCTYTKIGRQVTIKAQLVVGSVASPVGTLVTIAGLPFTSINSVAGRGSGSATYFPTVGSGSLALNYQLQNAAEWNLVLTASSIAAGDEFYITLTYFV